ncbi:MAG: hypothetical protein ACM3L5_00815 [Candidatus Saccharibacteria bacterium]
MKLEVHTFDPELINILMGREPVREGDELLLSGGARLVYERTFARRVKHFPLIIHFSVNVDSDQGACDVVKWLFDRVGKRNLEKIVVEYQDVRMDAEQMKYLLGCKK